MPPLDVISRSQRYSFRSYAIHDSFHDILYITLASWDDMDIAIPSEDKAKETSLFHYPCAFYPLICKVSAPCAFTWVLLKQ